MVVIWLAIAQLHLEELSYFLKAGDASARATSLDSPSEDKFLQRGLTQRVQLEPA